MRPRGQKEMPGRNVRPADTDDDAEAMKRLAAGEISAIAPIYDRHQAAVFAFVARLTRDDPDVEDIVHTTFLTAARRASAFDGRPSCRPWLLGIAAQLVRRKRRSFARFARALFNFAFQLQDIGRDPMEVVGARDQLIRVERAFAALPEAKRAVLLLAEVEGMACEEIARTLGIPVGTVWTRLHHARRELARALDAKEAR